MGRQKREETEKGKQVNYEACKLLNRDICKDGNR